MLSLEVRLNLVSFSHVFLLLFSLRKISGIGNIICKNSSCCSGCFRVICVGIYRILSWFAGYPAIFSNAIPIPDLVKNGTSYRIFQLDSARSFLDVS